MQSLCIHSYSEDVARLATKRQLNIFLINVSFQENFELGSYFHFTTSGYILLALKQAEISCFVTVWSTQQFCNNLVIIYECNVGELTRFISVPTMLHVTH